MKAALPDAKQLAGKLDAGSSHSGAAVAGGGALLYVLGRILGSSLLRAVGVLAALAGAALFVRQRIEERSRRIEEAADHIRSELDDLDPVAKAQVIADLAHPSE
jgi:hypothetical protein